MFYFEKIYKIIWWEKLYLTAILNWNMSNLWLNILKMIKYFIVCSIYKDFIYLYTLF